MHLHGRAMEFTLSMGRQQVKVMPTSAKKVEHSGMKVQLLGMIELATDRHNPQDFVALGEPQRILMQPPAPPSLLKPSPPRSACPSRL